MSKFDEKLWDKKVLDNLRYELDKKGLTSKDVNELTKINQNTVKNYISRPEPVSPSFQNMVKIIDKADIPFFDILKGVYTPKGKEVSSDLTDMEVSLIKFNRQKPDNMSEEVYKAIKTMVTTILDIIKPYVEKTE